MLFSRPKYPFKKKTWFLYSTRCLYFLRLSLFPNLPHNFFPDFRFIVNRIYVLFTLFIGFTLSYVFFSQSSSFFPSWFFLHLYVSINGESFSIFVISLLIPVNLEYILKLQQTGYNWNIIALKAVQQLSSLDNKSVTEIQDVVMFQNFEVLLSNKLSKLSGCLYCTHC